MRQLIENNLTITCNDVDFSTATNIEVWIRQGKLFFEYTPTVDSAHVLSVTVPFADAKQLTVGNVALQWACVDSNGKPVAPDPMILTVGVLLKEVGYAPV